MKKQIVIKKDDLENLEYISLHDSVIRKFDYDILNKNITIELQLSVGNLIPEVNKATIVFEEVGYMSNTGYFPWGSIAGWLDGIYIDKNINDFYKLIKSKLKEITIFDKSDNEIEGEQKLVQLGFFKEIELYFGVVMLFHTDNNIRIISKKITYKEEKSDM